MRVLMAEDDPRLSAVLAQSLEEAGWQVEAVGDGRQAFQQALDGGYDVLLLDWMLPGLSGPEVCRRLRGLGVLTPVLLLTARGELNDRVGGLDAGADDYLVKPFDLDELLARLRALHRRSAYQGPDVVRAGDLEVDASAHRVTRAGREIELSAREFAILHLLVSRAGQVVSRYDIIQEVWDGETDLRSNVIDVHLAAIRTKIDRPWGTSTITTLRGVGYRAEIAPTPPRDGAHAS